uniref:AlNc14C254G9688 protein n=1 Tax=Albugo laibachii Nc14 TaxID=890382 RepID=F0WTK9_9STRA|nr:AlNc14C254G9688 [Albugo laibachii Nc14]|eukprot:CCA24700.1 AlNc14C254G9688 [Albugo laibachii Nc14]
MIPCGTRLITYDPKLIFSCMVANFVIDFLTTSTTFTIRDDVENRIATITCLDENLYKGKMDTILILPPSDCINGAEMVLQKQLSSTQQGEVDLLTASNGDPCLLQCLTTNIHRLECLSCISEYATV